MKEENKKENLFWKDFGPALLVLALGIGSGELILWPYLTAKYGFGILWGALLGITIQLILINIISRDTVIFSKNILIIFSKVFLWIFPWIIFSTVIGFGWPGFSSLASDIITKGFEIQKIGNFEIFLPLSIFILIFSGSILVFSKNAYKKILFLEKVMMSGLFLLTIYLFAYYFNIEDFKNMIFGLVGYGGEYYFFPNISEFSLFLATFFGAVAYAGSGGNLILGNSFFIMNEKKEKNVEIAENKTEKKNKIKNIFKQNLLFFWFGGLAIIAMLSYVSFVVLQKISSSLPDDFSFLILESNIFSEDISLWIGKVFIFLAVFAIFGVQLGILDFIGRVSKNTFSFWKDKKSSQNNIKTKLENYLLKKSQKDIYKTSVMITVFMGVLILLAGFDKPKSLIVVGAVINAFSMGVISWLLFLVEKKEIPENLKSSKIKIILLLITLFYFSFFGYIVFDKFFL